VRSEAPKLERLLRWLSETPPEFLLDGVSTPALVSDVLRDLGGDLLDSDGAQAFRADATKEKDRWAKLVQVTCWLLSQEDLARIVRERKLVERAEKLLRTGLLEVAQHVAGNRWVSDPDRREELARLTLSALSLLPEGEKAAQFEDRLTTLSTVARQRVLKETEAALRRAEKIRQEMAKKAAEEAASRYSRE